jgi:hypothetical protein
MREVRAAHATDMHATEAAGVHAATKASAAVHSATEAATTVTAAAETSAAMAAASTAAAASGEHGRSDRHDCHDRRRSETFENPVVHRTILVAVRR